MIGLDTNVLVRFIMRDDAEQTAQADALVATLTTANPGFVSLTTLTELWWVLGRSYGRTQTERSALFTELFDTDELVVTHSDLVREALSQIADGADFADALIASVSQASGCQSIATFDHQAAQRAGMTLVDDLIRKGI